MATAPYGVDMMSEDSINKVIHRIESLTNRNHDQESREYVKDLYPVCVSQVLVNFIPKYACLQAFKVDATPKIPPDFAHKINEKDFKILVDGTIKIPTAPTSSFRNGFMSYISTVVPDIALYPDKVITAIACEIIIYRGEAYGREVESKAGAIKGSLREV